jgi:hypothetical protein
MFGLFKTRPTPPALRLSSEGAALLRQLHEDENTHKGARDSAGNASPDTPTADPLAPQTARAKTREEKRAQRAKDRDEKRRAKKRKRMTVARFSRARYMREAHGNATARLIIWLMLGLFFLIGPFLLNTKFLLPKTNANLVIIAEIQRLETEHPATIDSGHSAKKGATKQTSKPIA